jgi:hypothetical protein
VLGLGPPGSLNRLPQDKTIHTQLHTLTTTPQIHSITLLTATTGILTLGGSLARLIERAKLQSDLELAHFGSSNPATPDTIVQEVENQLNFRMPPAPPADPSTSQDAASDDERHFKWQPITGPSGWWTFLIRSIRVSGAKILRNQPALLNIQSPFILAPSRDAVERFYAAIPGSFRLAAAPQKDGSGGRFFAVPCFDGQRGREVMFELGGWTFPMFAGREIGKEEALYGPLGGAGSLGVVEEGSGFCVGVVVESRIGEAREDGDDGGGLRGTWVLGEPFFRGMGVLFDADGEHGGKDARVGFRAY